MIVLTCFCTFNYIYRYACDDVLHTTVVLLQSPEMIHGVTQLLKTNTAISELVLSNVGIKW